MTADARTRPKRLLALGAGPSQLGLLERARARGLYVIAADRDPRAPGFPLADRRALISAEDEPALERLAAAEEVDGVIAPGIDSSVGIAARIAAKLGLPHPLSRESAQIACSRLRQRERFAEIGLAQPRYAVANRVDAAEAAAAIGFPVVVKAADRQGRRGMALAREAGELAASVEVALSASRSDSCLIEALVAGREVTVTAFSLAGRWRPLMVSDRERAEPPAFAVALAHIWPSLLEERELRRALELAGAAVAALGILAGPSSVQLVVGREGPRLTELVARLGGGHDAELCSAAVGVDLNGVALAAALGEDIPQSALEPSASVGGACVRFLVAPEGELGDVTGGDEVAAMAGIERLWLYREPGHRFGPLRAGSDRAGAVLAIGADRKEAVERAERAADLIRFETVHGHVPL
ncbi:MAG: ATP-grasp domain-containing protein [Gaiellaceae bacterium]